MDLNFSGLKIPGLVNLGVIWVVSIGLLTIIVHLTFAAAVLKDAQRHEKPIFVLPGVWFIATLLGGVFVAAVYWALHHSSLNPSNSETPIETENETIL